MSFEGSEKKVEVVVDTAAGGSLRALGRDFWEAVVGSAEARVLSEVGGERCTAYLLSESSLFVRDDTFVMITCGGARLVEGVLSFVEKFGEGNILSLIFQRKNEYDSRLQRSTFEQDASRLARCLGGGTSLRFGRLDEHHTFMFTMGRNFCPAAEDRTTEFLMYHIGDEAARFFRREDLGPDDVRSFLDIDDYLGGFAVDDHVFYPCGYSFNAIRGDRYMTVHITPQEDVSYASFETNVALEGRYAGLVGRMAEALRPYSFDLIDFNAATVPAGGFTRINSFSEHLGCGYRVDFSHFIAAERTTGRPAVLRFGEGA